jgi:hypothetical protein
MSIRLWKTTLLFNKENQVFAKYDGNREWTIITEVSLTTEKRDIPSSLIVKDIWLLDHICKQLDNSRVILTVSSNGWTDNDLSFEWLKYFDKYTKDRSIERYRILIFDGYGSHGTVQFVTYAYKYNILLIYLSPYSIYISPSTVGRCGIWPIS